VLRTRATRHLKSFGCIQGPNRLEANDDPGGDPKVILRTASELRQQVVSLNYAPSELVGDFGINAASERQRKGRISGTRGAIMRSSKE
jgi:hypothetical protein